MKSHEKEGRQEGRIMKTHQRKPSHRTSCLSRARLARGAGLGATLAFAVALGACAPAHIAAYKPKKREFALDNQAKNDINPVSEGSLWLDGKPASMLFTDARALRENDLLVIKIEEVADAKRSADTNLAHDSETAAQVNAFLGLLTKLQSAGIDPSLSIGGGMKSSFKGEGSSARSEYLTATVPAMVRKVLPNGNLFVEGHRVILVNAEEQHFYISGVVRPIDIDQENSVKSSMVADAEIEFVGSGDLTDNQSQGKASRYLNWIWPF
jgi:flagellar L-ring protein precursor FlgH